MPRFTFETTPGCKTFSCQLRSSKCRGIKEDGSPCTRKSCIGIEYCWQHLASQGRLRIAPSTIPGSGRGLFAWLTANNRAKSHRSDVVFKKGATILPYSGERVTEKTLQARYGDKTAPYGVGNDGIYIDAACQRSAAAMANGSDKNHRANAMLVLHKGAGIITLKATNDIRHGEEIFCNYGSGYWEGIRGTRSRTG